MDASVGRGEEDDAALAPSGYAAPFSMLKDSDRGLAD